MPIEDLKSLHQRFVTKNLYAPVNGNPHPPPPPHPGVTCGIRGGLQVLR